VNRQVVCAMLLVLLGACVILFPYAHSVTILFILASICGLTAGGFDTAQIVWIIEMWENPGVFIQTQHFAYALGTLISPLLVKPFLADDQHGSEGKVDQGTTLWIPFTIGGSITILGAGFIIGLFLFKKYEPPEINSNREDSGCKKTGSNSDRIFLIIFSAIFLGAYNGMELCTLQFFPSFTHYIDLELSEQDGAFVLSSLTGAFTLGRGLGILLVLRAVPEVILIGNISLVTLGNLVLYFLANSSITFLWIGAVLLGVGFSTVFPLFFGYIEQYLEISNVVGGVILVAGGFFSGLYPVLIGDYMEVDPFMLTYTNALSVVICIFSFGIIYFITTRTSKTKL